jgi:hypothetical protein
MTDDRLVAAYLRRLRRAARKLPRAQRQELIEHITEYIAESRAAGASSAEAGPAELRNALERLGEPRDIVAAARGHQVPARRPGGLEIAAVLLLLLGGVAGLILLGIPGLLIGLGIGVVLMWVSRRWSWPDKLLGTLVFPGGLAAVLLIVSLPVSAQVCGGSSTSGGATDCTGGSVPSLWLSIPLTLALAIGPIAVAIRLLTRARRLPDPGEPVVTGLAG